MSADESRHGSTDDPLRAVLIVIAAVLLLPVVMMAVAMPMMGMWWVGGKTSVAPLWGVVMMLLWVLMLGGVGYLLYRVVRGAGDASGLAGGEDPALEELRLAYARGELSDEEFERRREQLERSE